MFVWRPPQPVEEIDTMKVALVYEMQRKTEGTSPSFYEDDN
jgi:hypothetical protein